MGREPDYEREGEHRWLRPREDIERDGCPGGWYRTEFIGSLMRYYRRRDGKGGRNVNPHLDACDDPFVISCILEIEGHEEASLREFYKAMEAG